MQYLNMTRVKFVQILKNFLKLSVISNDKFILNEAGAFVENVVPGFNIENVSFLVSVFTFYLILDNEGHVTEWERKKFV
jgi:hypothetical protein